MNRKIFTLRIVAAVMVFCLCFGCLSACQKTEDTSSNRSDEILGEVVIGGDEENGDDAASIGSGGSGSKISSGSGSGSTKIDMNKLKGQTVNMLIWRKLNTSEKTVLENFKKSTSINVKYSIVNQKEYLTKLAAEVAGGSGPDICAIQSGGMSILTSDSYPSSFPVGTLAVMQPFFPATGQDEKESIWAKSWMDPYKIKGQYYGVAIAGGWQTLSTVVYYNKDLFEENGLTTPKELWKAGNWNWDTFKQSALAISNIDDYYYGYAGRDSYAYMLSSGCDYVSFDGTKFTNTSNTAQMKKAWEFATEMYDSGAQFRPDGTTNFPLQFLEGRFGMYGEGSYCMSNVGMMGDYAYNLKDVGFEIDAVPFPSPKGQDTVCISRGDLFGIAKNSRNPVAAGVFLRFWLDPKNALPFSKTAINNNMRDVFDWINKESTPKKAFISGGVLGYQDADKMAALTYTLMTNPAAQINTTLNSYQPFINTSIDSANKVIS